MSKFKFKEDASPLNIFLHLELLKVRNEIELFNKVVKINKKRVYKLDIILLERLGLNKYLQKKK